MYARKYSNLWVRIELTTSSSSTDALTTDLLEALWREESKINQSYNTCYGDLLDIFKKKKCEGNITEEKIPLLLLLKKNKQTKNGKTKQNKSLVSISNVGDQLWLGLVLNRSQASADLQRQVLL